MDGCAGDLAGGDTLHVENGVQHIERCRSAGTCRRYAGGIRQDCGESVGEPAATGGTPRWPEGAGGRLAAGGRREIHAEPGKDLSGSLDAVVHVYLKRRRGSTNT